MPLLRLRLLVCLSLGLLLLGGPPAAVAVVTSTCSPTNYVNVTNDAPLPANFCSFAYLPWRARLPDTPQHTVPSQTSLLQNQYLNTSRASPADTNIQKLVTIDMKPIQSNQGNSYYPVYKASPTDPLVSVRCGPGEAGWGCSDGNQQQVFSVPSFRIPAWARVNQPFDEGDNLMEIIQPNGDTVGILGCANLSRDFQNGDVLQDLCDRVGGLDYTSIVTGAGVNISNLNGGPDLSALVAHYNEVVPPGAQINHALLAFSGCFNGAQYPALYQALGCGPNEDQPGLPAGAHVYLALTRAQIDALPTNVVPVHMRPFAYALHEYGMYIFDTGNREYWIGTPMLEQAHAYLNRPGAPTYSYWHQWFLDHGSGGVGGDRNIQLYGYGKVIDWTASQIRTNMYALDECYARGTCSDSVPEGFATTCPPDCPATGAAWWKFDEGGGTSAADTPPGTRTMTVTNSWSAPGKVGPSAYACGSGQAERFTDTQYSYVMWVQASTLPVIADPGQGVLHNGTTEPAWGFNWSHPAEEARQAAWHRDASGTYHNAKLTAPLQTNTWYHIAATYNGSELRAYLNGVREATTAVTSLWGAQGNFSLCTVPNAPTLPGRVDEVKVYPTALSDAEILADFTATQGTGTRRRGPHVVRSE